MGFACGIVGLPNVGKSTLFNALSATQQAEAANYPFCTIEPNVGVVGVADPRMDALVKVVKPKKVVPTTMEFVDIAGLVRGASKGEGLGNQFLANIREVNAIAHVVRCFEDENIVHVEGRIDPASDIATIDTELGLKDLESVEKRLARAQKAMKGPEAKTEKPMFDLCTKLMKGLNDGVPVRAIPVTDDEQPARARAAAARRRRRSCTWPTSPRSSWRRRWRARTPHVEALRKVADKEGAPVVVICAAVEAEISTLPKEEQPEFLASLGLDEPGLQQGGAHRLRAARPHHVLHGRRDRSARLDHRQGHQGAAGGGHHPHRLRARLHQGRDHLVGGSRQARLRSGLPRGGQARTSRARIT